MKVLFINSVCGIGSTGRIVESLYSFLKQKGHDVKIAYGRNVYDKIPQEDQFCFYNKINIVHHGVMSRIFDNSGLNYSKCATKKLIKFIDNFNPDVVNLHNLHGYYLNIPMLLKYLGEKNIKCVFTLHDCWLFTGHCSHFYYNKCDGYKNDCSNCKFKKCYPKSLVMSRAKKNFQLKKQLLDGIKNKSFICPSNWLKNFAKHSALLKNEKIDVVYNAIDYSVFNLDAKSYFDKSKLPADNYILCVANYWNETKGLDKIIELSKVLPEDLKIVMVGYLKDKSILNDKIVYIEHTNNVKELAFYYANAKVFYNPTLEDNFPTVNIESLACGTPIVLFKGCSGGEELIDDENGEVIDKTSSPNVVLNKILDKKSKNKKISTNIMKVCDINKFNNQYFERFKN